MKSTPLKLQLRAFKSFLRKNREKFKQYYHVNILKPKKLISAMIRVKNEEDFLLFSVKSIIDSVDEVVIIDNLSTDKTPEIINSLKENYPNKIFSYKYDYEVKKVGQENLELMSKPFSRLSPHLLANYYNWCLKKCRCPYVLKWDGDMIATPNFSKILTSFRQLNKSTILFKGANIYPDLNHLVAPIYSKIKAMEANLFNSASLENYVTAYTDYEFRVFPKSFARYDTYYWWCENLSSPFCGEYSNDNYNIYINEPCYLHMKYCKKDPYSNFSEDFKTVVSSSFTKGMVLDSELKAVVDKWLR